MLQETIEDYIASLATPDSTRSNNRNTVLAYRNDLVQLRTYLVELGLLHWSQVTCQDIEAYLLWMREEQSYRPTTIARKLAAFKAFFRYMCSVGTIEEDPTKKLETPPVQKDLPQVLCFEQVCNLFRQVEVDTPVGRRDLAMLHMLYSTGMRASELVSLNLDDYDSANMAMICPCHGKQTNHERVLPLTVVALEAFQCYLEEGRPCLVRRSEEQALFLNHRGERLTRQGFWLIIKGYARQAGIIDITPHMLRHSFALHMLSEGMELRSVQELLGHAHISTTQVYSQLVLMGLDAR